MTRQADGLQYGSRAAYGTALTGCDTNGARVPSEADMQHWLTGGTAEMPLTDAEWAKLTGIVTDAANTAAKGTARQVHNDLAGTLQRIVDDLALDKTAAMRLDALTAQLAAVQATVAKLTPGAAGGPLSGQVTGSLTITPTP